LKIVFYRGASRRSAVIERAVRSGLQRHGAYMTAVDQSAYQEPDADVAVFYGLAGNLKRLQRAYVAAGLKTVFFDLGYWCREGETGFYRVVLNALHANAYFQRIKHGPERFSRFGIETKPFTRSGSHVLLCGMSAKAAWVYDLEPQQWERAAVATAHACSLREVRYRPKPSWLEASPIADSTWAPSVGRPIDEELAGAWACVSHHSNAGLDALIAGVPVFAIDGLAAALGRSDVHLLEDPRIVDEGERDQLLFDAAHTQYSVPEIADGTLWRYLRDEGLI
jgi:hypothetical protein